MVEASRNFVCVRLHAREDLENLRLSKKYASRVDTVELYLLDPSREKVLLQWGERTFERFLEETGGAEGIAREMNRIAQKYPGKSSAAGERPVPWMKSLEETMLQAHADAKPAVLLLENDPADGAAFEKLLRTSGALEKFQSAFLFVKVPAGSEEAKKYRLSGTSSTLFLRPSRYGTEASVMKTTADRDALARSMQAAEKEFAETFPVLSRDEVLEKGVKEKIGEK